MAKKFVRNITGTTLTGKDKEPLFTNMQNDLLSDDEDVAVRNKKEYHLLTDNLKTHLVKTNAFMSISEKEKNGLKLNVLQASDTEVKNAVDTPRVINPKQAKDMIEQRTPKIVRDIIETDVPQSDWNETDPNSKAFILNKPDIENGGGGGVTVPDFSSQAQAETGTNNSTIMTPKSTKQAIDKQVPLIVAEQATTIIEQNFEALPQPDWDETNQESHGYIKNKPDIPDFTEIIKTVELTDAVNKITIQSDNSDDDYYYFFINIPFKKGSFNHMFKFTDYFSKIKVYGELSITSSDDDNAFVTNSFLVSNDLLTHSISEEHEGDYHSDGQIRIHIKRKEDVSFITKKNLHFSFSFYDLDDNYIFSKNVIPTIYETK